MPVFIKEIVQKLEENSHLETEGLYRVPADRKKRRELLEYFDSSYKIGGKIIWPRIPTVKLKIPGIAFLKSESRTSVTFKLYSEMTLSGFPSSNVIEI